MTVTWQWATGLQRQALCAAGRPVVTDGWLAASALSGSFVEAAPDHLLVDRAAERRDGFDLARTHERAQAGRLLAGSTVLLSPGAQARYSMRYAARLCTPARPSIRGSSPNPMPAPPYHVDLVPTAWGALCRPQASGPASTLTLTLISTACGAPCRPASGGGRSRRGPGVPGTACRGNPGAQRGIALRRSRPAVGGAGR